MYPKTRFTKSAERIMIYAKEYVLELGQNILGSEHILLGILKEGECIAARILLGIGITEDKVYKAVGDITTADAVDEYGTVGMTPRAREIFERAYKISDNLKQKMVGTEHILLAMIDDDNNIAVQVLRMLGVNMSKLEDKVVVACTSMSGETGTTRKTPNLDKYSRDLTELAYEGRLDNVVGRKKEIQRAIQILLRRTKNNPCLIGEPGVGKTAIAEGIAIEIINNRLGQEFKDKRLVALDLTSMVAGTKYRGEFEERLKKVLDEVVLAGNILLFVDEVHTLIGAGAAEGSIDAANIMKPMLARGEIQLIGATTITEYRRHIEKDSALERRFQPVIIEQPNEKEAFDILMGLKEKYESYHGIIITDESILSAVRLSAQYINDRFLPDKAIDLMDEAASGLKIESCYNDSSINEYKTLAENYENLMDDCLKRSDFDNANEYRKKLMSIRNKIKEYSEQGQKNDKLILTTDRIAEVVSQWTGIPITRLSAGEETALCDMVDVLNKRIIGQADAVKAVSKAIKRGRTGIKNPKRPIGTFIFAGPTGVGKTELANQLAYTVFGDEKSLVRVDMSELMEQHSVAKLIGAPPGYVGYDDGGKLTESVRKKPYSVVLLDEIEKAHPDALNILLQVLEDGFLTDSQGHKVDFRNTVIVMTTNIGAADILNKRPVGFDSESKPDMSTDLNAMLKKNLKPEFINRVDDIIVFNMLSSESLVEIAKNMLEELSERLRDSGIFVSFDESVARNIIGDSYDYKYGARPLRRKVQSVIEDYIADSILNGKIERHKIYTVSYDGQNVASKIMMKDK